MVGRSAFGAAPLIASGLSRRGVQISINKFICAVCITEASELSSRAVIADFVFDHT